jgi:hypothetical protein
VIVGKVGRRPHSVDVSTKATNVDDARGGRGRGERRRAAGEARGAFVDRFDRAVARGKRARRWRRRRRAPEDSEDSIRSFGGGRSTRGKEEGRRGGK